jgi:hypothetical protein
LANTRPATAATAAAYNTCNRPGMPLDRANVANYLFNTSASAGINTNLSVPTYPLTFSQMADFRHLWG